MAADAVLAENLLASKFTPSNGIERMTVKKIETAILAVAEDSGLRAM